MFQEYIAAAGFCGTLRLTTMGLIGLTNAVIKQLLEALKESVTVIEFEQTCAPVESLRLT